MTILHVDMEAFYASVEAVKDPSLAGKPVIVGGLAGRGVVTSASYQARAFGVHSAMPAITARRLCPHAIFIANDFEAYSEFSSRIREVFFEFTPLVEPLSLDEAFLDVSGSLKLFGSPEAIGHAVKGRIAELGLACTVGIAPNKFIAKLASARAKPDGFLVIRGQEITRWLHPLPVGALWGVGAQTEERLRRLGLKRVGDIAALPRSTLERALGHALGGHLFELAHGIDDRPVKPFEAPKSVGCEETFSHDLDHRAEILREILRLSDRVAGRLRAKALCGRTVSLKLRWSSFKTITRSKTLAEEIDTAQEIYEVAKELFSSLAPDRPRIRLVGVSLTGLTAGPPSRQLGLFGEGGRARRDAARAVDHIRDRFGDRAVGSATLLDELS